MFACGQDEMGMYDASGQGSEDVFSSSPSSDFEAPVVVLLEDELCFESLEFMAEEQNQIHFQFSCSIEDIDLEIGDVIAGVIGGGYLGRVIGLERGSDFLVVFTEYVPLSEVVEDGEFSVSLQETGARSLIDLSGKTLYNETHAGMHVESGFRSGYLRLKPETQLGAKMQWGRLERFDATVGMRLDANFEYYVGATGAHRIDEEYPVTNFEFPFYADVSGIPVAGTVKYELFVRFVSETTGYLDMTVGSYQGHWDWTMGGRYRPETGWQDAWDTNTNSSLSGIEVVGDTGWKGRIEFSMRPRISFYQILSVWGLHAGYLRGRADPECDGIRWSFDDGTRVEATLSVKWLERFIPDMPVTVPMGNSQWEIDSGVIPWPGDLPSALLPACGGSLPWDQGPQVSPTGISCGDSVSGDTSDTDQSTDLLNGYSCNVGNYQASEVVYAYTATHDGPVNFRLVNATPSQVNHDLFVLDGDPTSSPIVLQNSCLATGMNSMSFEATAGETYLLVVDGYSSDEGSFEAYLEC